MFFFFGYAVTLCEIEGGKEIETTEWLFLVKARFKDRHGWTWEPSSLQAVIQNQTMWFGPAEHQPYRHLHLSQRSWMSRIPLSQTGSPPNKEDRIKWPCSCITQNSLQRLASYLTRVVSTELVVYNYMNKKIKIWDFRFIWLSVYCGKLQKKAWGHWENVGRTISVLNPFLQICLVFDRDTNEGLGRRANQKRAKFLRYFSYSFI